MAKKQPATYTIIHTVIRNRWEVHGPYPLSHVWIFPTKREAQEWVKDRQTMPSNQTAR